MNAKRARRRFVVILALALFPVGDVLAQVGRIAGTVEDEQGNPISEAQIRIEGIDVKRKYSTKTSTKGVFVHAGVSLQGIYRVIADKPGFRSDHVDGVKPSFGSAGGRDQSVRLTLKRGAGGETVSPMTAEEVEAAREAAADAERTAKLKESFRLGAEAYNIGDYQVARDRFMEATRIAPDEASAWSNLAQTQMRLEQYEAALDAYKKVVELNAADFATLQGMADAYAALGNAEAADQYAKKAAEAAASANAGSPASGYYNLAMNYVNAGKNPEAGEALKKAIAADPGHAEARYQLGLVLLGEGKTGEAKRSLQKYLELDPNGVNADTATALIGSLPD